MHERYQLVPEYYAEAQKHNTSHEKLTKWRKNYFKPIAGLFYYNAPLKDRIRYKHLTTYYQFCQFIGRIEDSPSELNYCLFQISAIFIVLSQQLQKLKIKIDSTSKFPQAQHYQKLWLSTAVKSLSDMQGVIRRFQENNAIYQLQYRLASELLYYYEVAHNVAHKRLSDLNALNEKLNQDSLRTPLLSNT